MKNIFRLNLSNICLFQNQNVDSNATKRDSESKFISYDNLCNYQIKFVSDNDNLALLKREQDDKIQKTHNFIHQQNVPLIQYRFGLNDKNNIKTKIRQNRIKFEEVFKATFLIITFKNLRKCCGLKFSTEIVTFSISLKSIIDQITDHPHFHAYSKLQFNSENRKFKLNFDCEFRETCINFQHVIHIQNKLFKSLFTDLDFYPYLIFTSQLPQKDDNTSTINQDKEAKKINDDEFELGLIRITYENKESGNNNHMNNTNDKRKEPDFDPGEHHLHYEIDKTNNRFILNVDEIDAKLLTNAQLVIPSFDYFWQDNLFNNLYSFSCPEKINVNKFNYWDMHDNHRFVQTVKMEKYYPLTIIGQQYFINSPIIQLDNYHKNDVRVIIRTPTLQSGYSFRPIIYRHSDSQKSLNELRKQLEAQIIIHFNLRRIKKISQADQNSNNVNNFEQINLRYQNLIKVTLHHTFSVQVGAS